MADEILGTVQVVKEIPKDNITMNVGRFLYLKCLGILGYF